MGVKFWSQRKRSIDFPEDSIFNKKRGGMKTAESRAGMANLGELSMAHSPGGLCAIGPHYRCGELRAL